MMISAIKAKLRVYFIGGPKKWCPRAWRISHSIIRICGALSAKLQLLRVVYGWNQGGDLGNKSFVVDIPKAAALGDYFAGGIVA